MRFEQFPFGLIRIDGLTCEHDVVVERGEVRKHKKNQRSHDPGHSSDGWLSTCRVLSSPLLALFYDFAQIRNRPYLIRSQPK